MSYEDHPREDDEVMDLWKCSRKTTASTQAESCDNLRPTTITRHTSMDKSMTTARRMLEATTTKTVDVAVGPETPRKKLMDPSGEFFFFYYFFVKNELIFRFFRLK